MKALKLPLWGALALIFNAGVMAEEDTKKPIPVVPKPCTIKSPFSGTFYDLNGISASTAPNRHKNKAVPEPPRSWTARGHDYAANFTLNFCEPVVEDLHNVVGLPETSWPTVGAYYSLNSETFSLGNISTEPVFRGRKLVLNYTNGSPCPDIPFSRPAASPDLPRAATVAFASDAVDKAKAPVRRKSAIISLLCDRDPIAPTVTISFVGTVDECTYFFESRSLTACGGVEVAKQPLGPEGVFGMIALIAIAVYFVGGCFYNRIVNHRRGMRQLPNFEFWAGLVGGILNVFRFFFGRLFRCLPYNGLFASKFGQRTSLYQSRIVNADSSNRLLEDADEQWDNPR